MPNFRDPWPGGPTQPWWQWTETVTTTTELPPPPHQLDYHMRRIARQELADLIPIDVPDAPPEEEESK